jgi:hypothetical protein
VFKYAQVIRSGVYLGEGGGGFVVKILTIFKINLQFLRVFGEKYPNLSLISKFSNLPPSKDFYFDSDYTTA